MTTLSLPVTLVAGANENVNDLNSNLNAITSWANGSVDATNITNAAVTGDKIGTTLAQQLGITNAANTGRGKVNITTSESRTNVAYGTLTTPDQVTGIVLPTDGLIAIAYQATWQESVNGAARAGLFLGANQLRVAQVGVAAGPTLVEAPLAGGSTAVDAPLFTNSSGASVGLSSWATATGAYTGDVTTGQIVGGVGSTSQPGGGPIYVFAAAGTYTISVQFKATSGSVTVKNRHLWVWVCGF